MLVEVVGVEQRRIVERSEQRLRDGLDQRLRVTALTEGS
jgi:hypothetical protein